MEIRKRHKIIIAWFCIQFVIILFMMNPIEKQINVFDVCYLMVIICFALGFFVTKSLVARISASIILCLYSISLVHISYLLASTLIIEGETKMVVITIKCIIFAIVILNLLASISLLVDYIKLHNNRRINPTETRNCSIIRGVHVIKLWCVLHFIICVYCALNQGNYDPDIFGLTIGVILLFCSFLLDSKRDWINRIVIIILWAYSVGFAFYYGLVFIWFCIDKITVFTFLIPIIIIANFYVLINRDQSAVGVKHIKHSEE